VGRLPCPGRDPLLADAARWADLSNCGLSATNRRRTQRPASDVLVRTDCQVYVVAHAARQQMVLPTGKGVQRQDVLTNSGAVHAATPVTLIAPDDLLECMHAPSCGGTPLSGVDFFTRSHWNAVGRIGRGCRSSAAFPALGRAADAQKRVPTTTCLHLRGGTPPCRRQSPHPTAGPHPAWAETKG
jgi:hypothetical protein